MSLGPEGGDAFVIVGGLQDEGIHVPVLDDVGAFEGAGGAALDVVCNSIFFACVPDIVPRWIAATVRSLLLEPARKVNDLEEAIRGDVSCEVTCTGMAVVAPGVCEDGACASPTADVSRSASGSVKVEARMRGIFL